MNKTLLNKMMLFLVITSYSYITFTQIQTSCIDFSKTQTYQEIVKFKKQALLLINSDMEFRKQQEEAWSITLVMPTGYFLDNFKNTLQKSSSLLGDKHTITLELTILYDQLNCYLKDPNARNYYANNTQARFAEENSIQNRIQKANVLLNKLII